MTDGVNIFLQKHVLSLRQRYSRSTFIRLLVPLLKSCFVRMASYEKKIDKTKVVEIGLKISKNDQQQLQINGNHDLDRSIVPSTLSNEKTQERFVPYYHEMVGDLGIYVMQGNTNTHGVIRDIVRADDVMDIEKPIFCTNLDNVIDHYHLWKKELPNVDIFYAVKTYDSPVMIQLMANLGCSFEVASKIEGEHCLQLGVNADRILCNHPYKRGPLLKFFAANNIQLMTVDSPDELDKIAVIYPDAQLLIRIIPAEDRGTSGFHSDVKFGATEAQVEELLLKAQELGLNMVGVSFHVGSDINDTTVHARSLQRARRVFDIARSFGYEFTILDIGGGFPAGKNPDQFVKLCEVLRPALDQHFLPEMNVRFIAEPGNYFASSAVTSYVSVMGRRKVARSRLELVTQDVQKQSHATKFADSDDLNGYIYVVNDGVWGSMNFIYVANDYKPLHALNPRPSAPVTPCVIWGPTCCGFDRLTNVQSLEEMTVGDWLYRPDAGAYAHTLRTNFNGMPQPRFLFTIHEENLHLLKKNGDIKMPYV